MKADVLESLEDGSVGLSSFHRDTLRISKIDEFAVAPAKIKDYNPLNQVELVVEVVFMDDE